MDLRECDQAVLQDMCSRYHGYGGAGRVFSYVFAVYEDGVPVASFGWKPPAPGAAKSVYSKEPGLVLSLSRMVAVPKTERRLKHISKPLKKQMKSMVDRSRWPVLVTYSDEGQGHTGYVYQCSGWKPTKRSKSYFWEDGDGNRTSVYRAGRTVNLGRPSGVTYLQRWEHWIHPDPSWVAYCHGWGKVATGKTWRNGSPAFRWEKL